LVASLRAAANQHFSISAGQHFSMGMDVRTKSHKQAPPVALLFMSMGAAIRGLPEVLKC
jgi:hypothetical protein